MAASILKNEIEVTYSIRHNVNREFLTINVTNGWDDVKKISNKVLTFENRKFTWSGWNSDTNKAFFFRILSGGVISVATIN